MQPKNQQPSASPLLLIGLIIAVIYFANPLGKPSVPGPSKPKPDIVEPDKPAKPTADQAWEALAKCVESKWIGGELQQHTDHLVKVADLLKSSGTVTDTARVDAWRAKRIEITDSNRAEIAKQIRGR